MTPNNKPLPRSLPQWFAPFLVFDLLLTLGVLIWLVLAQPSQSNLQQATTNLSGSKAEAGGVGSTQLAGNFQGKAIGFVALGDMGAGTPFQKAVAAQMRLSFEQEPFVGVLMLGDNIYPDGNIKKLGATHFQAMYQPLLDSGILFWPVLGNHDADSGFAADQIAYFKMPGRYYAFSIGDIDFFALDTNHFDAVQAQWLKQKLSQSPGHWRIVYGHHPVFSSGLHGNTDILQKTLRPLLEQYAVDLYLCGHDHDYERLGPVNGVEYIVSGGGGAYLRDFASPPLSVSKFREKTHHFLSFQLDRLHQTLQMEAIDAAGHVFDTWSVSKQQRLETPAA